MRLIESLPFIQVEPSLNEEQEHISRVARRAMQRQEWAVVHEGANRLLAMDPREPEGHFLMGLVQKAAQKPRLAVEAFEKALSIDSNRYDAAIELANQYVIAVRNNEAIELLSRYTDHLSNSPRYLDMAGTLYSNLGLPEKSWPLYLKANELQPDIELFRANMAACAVYLGKIDKAEEIYRSLLANKPNHQRNHYHLSRLRTARNDDHINEMLKVLEETNFPPERNVFLYYAIAKEYEDLEQWDNAFKYYKAGADAVSLVADYNPREDLDLIDSIIDNCSADWLAKDPVNVSFDHTPIFVLGLPRTGTTLTERIISNHSQVRSIGENQQIEILLRSQSGIETRDRMNVEIINAVSQRDLKKFSEEYMSSVAYQLGDEPYFLEKLPYNFLYAGFIAKALPGAKLIYVKRNPLDACFAMYKQVFTWAYKFSYNLDDLAAYYIAHVRLLDHWKSLLQDRLVVVEYESMVQNQETETRKLLKALNLPFEEQCLEFETNVAASTTASSVQVREGIHDRSVERWTHFADHLAGLKDKLTAAGIPI